MQTVIIFCILIFSQQSIHAQGNLYLGNVYDAITKSSVVGAQVQVKGTPIAVPTDHVGDFQLNYTGNLPFTILISSLGYITEEITITDPQKLIQIGLREAQRELEEVIITSGYTSQKKSDYSGAVSVIDQLQLKNKPAISFDQMLGGQATGVDLIQPTNILNNTPVLRIRGINSLTSGLLPTIIVDGVTAFAGNIGGLVGNNPLSDINPSDIESINVLKDASSSSIYGSRAANGVIVITTKKGLLGRPKVSYNMWVSRSTPYNLPKLLNAEQYTMIKNEAMTNSGRKPAFALMYNPDSSIVNTNWYDVAFEPGYAQNHHLSVSGSSGPSQYYFSSGYTDQNSYIKYNTFERYGIRFNLDHALRKNIIVGTRFSYQISNNVGPNTGAIPANSLGASTYNSEYITNEPLGRMTYVLPPNVPVYKADGSYSIQNKTSVGYGANSTDLGTINAYNLAMVQKLDVNTSRNQTILGNIFAQFNFLNDFSFKSLVGLNHLTVDNTAFLNPIHGGGASANGVATNTHTDYIRQEWTNTLSFSKSLHGVHHVSALLGNEAIKTQIKGWGAQRSSVTDPYYDSYQGGYLNIAPYGNIETENRLLSYFSNATYDYMKRYFIAANYRRDGLSALASGHKFGDFYGGSIGWNIANEPFYKKLPITRWIQGLRLRASYGLVGNSEIGDYPSIGAYNSYTYGGVPTLAFAQVANPDLKWESSKKLDVGINLNLLNDRLYIELDYYNNNVDGLILKAPQASSAGLPGNYINQNIGTMYNRGVELYLNGLVWKSKNWSWEANLNVSTLTNKVTSLASDVYVPSIFGVQNMTRVGYSVGSIFAVPCLGVNPGNGLMMFQNSEGKTVQYNHIGSPKWTYLDGTAAPAIDQYKDGVIQGPSLPKIFGGLNNTIKYKNFDLGIQLNFVQGNLLYNGTRATNSDQRYFNNGEFILDRWTHEGQVTEIQKLQYGDNVSAGFSFSATSKVEKGDYIKLKNIRLGYHIPCNENTILKYFSSLYVYAQGSNVYTLTHYRGSDPEVSINGNSIHSGKDQNVSPNAQVITVGVNMSF